MSKWSAKLERGRVSLERLQLSSTPHFSPIHSASVTSGSFDLSSDSPALGDRRLSTQSLAWRSDDFSSTDGRGRSQTLTSFALDPVALADKLEDLLRSTRNSKRELRRAKRGTRIRREITDILEEADANELVTFWEYLGAKEPSERHVDFVPPDLGRRRTHSTTLQSGPTTGRHDMDTSLLVPGGPDRRKQIQDAKDMYQTVLRNAERSNSAVPPYDFLELIGKGSFGRVYKCKTKGTSELVAVKILNVDDMDISADPRERDETVKDFRKEVSILQQLKDSNAKNVNMIHDAFDLHSQLWIISDYCTGGSVRTLMRANKLNPAIQGANLGLEEHFIIPIARELAVAMKCVHDIGVIHRDIKCTNVYVTEDGHIQLGDFGVVGVMDDGTSKRTTIIGTPYYMPLEMHTDTPSVMGGYGTEIDIWEYGCTIYEMATGLPPNVRVAPNFLASALESSAPRLEGGDYSDELRDFIAFCLQSDPKARPTAGEILKHPYVADTLNKCPTNSLVQLIDRYKLWEFKGGQRASLFNPGGAQAPLGLEGSTDDDESMDDDWNFSTSANFDQAFGQRYSQMLNLDFDGPQFEAPAMAGLPPIQTKDLTPLERIQKEHKERSANRGEKSLERLWNQDSKPYELHTPVEHSPTGFDSEPPLSDLPLRNLSNAGPARESTVMIDLDATPGFDNAPTFNFDFGDMPTIKAKARQSSIDREDEEEEIDDYKYGADDQETKRATREWTFPKVEPAQKKGPKRATMEWSFSTAEPAEPDEPDSHMQLPPLGNGDPLAAPPRPQLKHTATVPLGQFGDYIHSSQPTVAPIITSSPVRDSMASMIDLDIGLADPAEIVRPSTASSAAGSNSTEMTSGNPFDLEDDPEQNEIDRNRFSYHKQWQSEGGHPQRSSLRNMPMHTRGSSLSSTDSELDRMANDQSDVFDYHYDPKLLDTTREQLHIGIAPLDISHWPNFSTDGSLDNGTSPAYSAMPVPRLGDPGFPLQGGLKANGVLPRSLSRNRETSNGHRKRGEVEFPTPMPPHPDALLEDADSQTLAAELDRMLDDVHGAFRATARAMRMHTGDGGEDESISGTDSGWETSAAASGDEYGS